MARSLRDLPLIAAEFEAARLSFSKVRALTRVADSESEVELVELARHGTAAQTERMVRAARRVTSTKLPMLTATRMFGTGGTTMDVSVLMPSSRPRTVPYCSAR